MYNCHQKAAAAAAAEEVFICKRATGGGFVSCQLTADQTRRRAAAQTQQKSVYQVLPFLPGENVQSQNKCAGLGLLAVSVPERSSTCLCSRDRSACSSTSRFWGIARSTSNVALSCVHYQITERLHTVELRVVIHCTKVKVDRSDALKKKAKMHAHLSYIKTSASCDNAYKYYY